MNYYSSTGNYYVTSEVDVEAVKGLMGFLAAYGLFIFLVCTFIIVCQWLVFKKAGKPGWAALIPIYNFIVLLQVVELPLWYIILFFIPFANIYAIFKIFIELAHKFGKSTGFGVLTVFFPEICIAILAFGKAQYQGSNIQTESTQTSYNPGSVPSAPSVEPTENVNVKYCPVCGNPVSADATFCTMCGHKFE